MPRTTAGPVSAADVISSGNIVWNGPGGDASGVATDQQGTGTHYQYFWPCCGGGNTDFFQVNGVGRTSGLLQASGGQPTPDPQWPFAGGANFAVNPVNGQDVVISSAVGRIFATTNQGVTWFDIGDPAVFSSPGSFSVALAYGAPDPSAPAGIGNLGNFIYVGTARGPDLRHPGRRRQRHEQQLAQHLPGPGRLAGPVDHHEPDSRQPRGIRRDHHRRLLYQGLGPPGKQSHQHGLRVGQHHQQHPQPGLQHLRPDLRPDHRPQLGQAEPGQSALSSIVADWRYTIPNSAERPQWSGVPPGAVRRRGQFGRATARACTSRSTTA